MSLNTTGDTTPASFLDVTRFPVSDDGSYHYERDNIQFTDVAGTGYSGGGGTAKQIADSIREGEGVLVIHGVDYNKNGVYDFDARSPASSTRTCPLRRPTPPCAVSSRSPSDGCVNCTSVCVDGPPSPRRAIDDSPAQRSPRRMGGERVARGSPR